MCDIDAKLIKLSYYLEFPIDNYFYFLIEKTNYYFKNYSLNMITFISLIF